MKDIQLEQTSENTYDWQFSFDDVDTVLGTQQIRTAVIHTLLLHKYELRQYPYTEMGCDAHLYQKGLNNDTNMTLIEESIISSCKEIPHVQNAMCTVSSDGIQTVISELTVMMDTGKEVIIDDI